MPKTIIPTLDTSTYLPVLEDIIGAAMLAVLELGYRHLDTIALYYSERAVGEAVAEAAQRRVLASRESGWGIRLTRLTQFG